MNEKNYVGNGWENTQYDLVNVSVNLEKLNALPVDDYGNVRITVAKMKQPNAKSKATHTVYENNYVKTDKVAGGDTDFKKKDTSEPPF